MNPLHPRLVEFLETLSRPEFCNFRGDEHGKLIWNCNSITAGAEPVLKDMGADVAESLAYFEHHGGYCDCEILLNVAGPFSDE
jgi:hypothetical protein